MQRQYMSGAPICQTPQVALPTPFSCSVHLVPCGKNSLGFSKMFQMLLQYFEEKFAIFYVYEPLSNYKDIFDRVKKAAPFLQVVDDQLIVISYIDLSLQTFINVDRNDSLHVSEAFRNASPCGSDIYRRVYLKIRESDPLFYWKDALIRKKQARKSYQPSNPRAFFFRFASCANSERSVVTDLCYWKTSKGNQIFKVRMYNNWHFLGCTVTY